MCALSVSRLRDLRQCIRSPSLWRSLTITGDLGASCSLPRVLAFLHRMHLTRHIHRLKLRNVSAPLSPACPQVLLPHLEELDVSAQAPPSALASASLLACLQAPKLHRVAWFGPLHDTSAIHLARLIPHLRELELDPVCLGQPPKLSAHVVHLLQGALATAEMPRLALRATASSSQLGQRSCSPLAEETLQTLVRDSSDATGHRGGEEEVQLGRAAETELVFDHEDFAEDVAEAEPADAESSPTAQLDEEREAPLEAVGAADASSVRTEGLRLEYMYATATSVQMAARGPCKQHEVLKLGSCPMGYVPPASLGSLVRQCNQLGGLRELSLSFTHLGTEGLEAILAHCPRLRSLRVDTRAVNFDDACLRAIATACVQLEELVVNCPCVERTWGNDGVLRLAFRLSSLRKLHLGGFQANKNITAGALFRLVEKMPRLTHVFLQVGSWCRSGLLLLVCVGISC